MYLDPLQRSRWCRLLYKARLICSQSYVVQPTNPLYRWNVCSRSVRISLAGCEKSNVLNLRACYFRRGVHFWLRLLLAEFYDNLRLAAFWTFRGGSKTESGRRELLPLLKIWSQCFSPQMKRVAIPIYQWWLAFDCNFGVNTVQYWLTSTNFIEVIVLDVGYSDCREKRYVWPARCGPTCNQSLHLS